MLKRTLWTLISVAGASVALHAQDAEDLVRRASAHYQKGQYAESADAYQAAIDAGAGSQTVRYNTACSAALAGRTEDAFRHLIFALGVGYRDLWHLRDDDDFEALQGDPRWKGVLELCRANDAAYASALEEPELRAELLEMQHLDQKIRSLDHMTIPVHSGESRHVEDRGEGHEHAGNHDHGHEGHEHGDHPAHPVHGEEMHGVDAKHTARMKAIVARHGWPLRSMVGDDGAVAAWLLVQHADLDPEFQRRCLELMQAAPPGETNRQNVAYLTDRVLVNEGKKQLYGTQFWLVRGELVPRPIEAEAELDQRRKSVGLSSMNEYRTHMQGPHDH